MITISTQSLRTYMLITSDEHRIAEQFRKLSLGCTFSLLSFVKKLSLFAQDNTFQKRKEMR
jgi:hypothetical protein